MLHCLLLLVLLVAPAASDTCSNLNQYLLILDQLIADDQTSAAVAAHPSSSREDTSLGTCASADTCCSAQSEEFMREASTEIFHTHSISMAMSTIEEELRDIRDAAISDILSVSQAADGTVAGEAARQYVVDQDIEVDIVGRYRLAHFVSSVYGASWQTFCLDPLEETRSLMSERVFTLLDQYKKMVSGLLEGINKMPSLKVLAISELSESCMQALTRTSMYEGLGCKKCSDATAPVKTCYNTCTNVARGCLRPLLCHTEDWETWSVRQDILTQELDELSSKRGAFFDALVERFEMEYSTAVRESNWNVVDCNIELNTRSISAITSLKSADVTLPAVQTGIFRAQFSMRLMDLPENACAQSSSVSDIQYEADAECWNGAGVSPYIHPTPQYSLEEQKCNPEVLPVQLSCDSEEMMCAGYDIGTTAPPTEPPTDHKAVKGNSAGRIVSSLMLVLVTLVAVL